MEETFMISLDPKSQFYNFEFHEECLADNIKVLDESLIERILYFKCGTFEDDDSALRYLIHAFNNSNNKSLIMNYVGLVLDKETSDMFMFKSKKGFTTIIDKLISNDAPDDDFLNYFFDNYNDQIPGLLKYLNDIIRQKWISDRDLMVGLSTFSTLMGFKQVVNAMVKHFDFMPTHATPKTLQVLSLFGPFLGNSSVFPDGDPKLVPNWFSSYDVTGECRVVNGVIIGNRNMSDVETAQRNLVDLSAGVSNLLSSTTLKIIKSGIEGKEGVLEFFAKVLKMNKDRGKLQMDPLQVATNGFMFNITQICLNLCDPILDPHYAKLGLIKDSFLFLSSRLDIQEDTRINADQHGADEFTNDLKKSAESQSNFVSEIFFLAFAYHHYGILSIIRYSGSLGKQLDKMKEQVEKLRQDELNGAWDGPMRAMYSNQFKNFQNQFDKKIGEKLATDGVLMDKHNIEHSIKFYNLAILWLIRCASAGKYDVDTFNRQDLPALMKGDSKHSEIMHLPPQSPKLFSVLPEWMFEDVCEFYLYVLRARAHYFETISRDEIVTFALIFLSNSSYLRNPYLKSKLVEILYHLTHALYQDSTGRTFGNLNDVFLTHSFARQNLIHCLTTFYIDVEQSGMHSQFYEKFSIRYHISQIFKSVWDDSHHRKMFIQESKKKEQFVRFAALLMNDTTYLLDESLSKLKEIQTIQNELDIPLSNPGQGEQEARNQKLQTLEQYERQALSTMSLGRETVNMFQYLTGCAEMIDPFMAPEVVDRLAAMLNFNLVALCGPRCSELKVREPEKYRFKPKELLNNLVQIYINLSERSEFIMAVAKDGRSYSKKLFHKAGHVLYKLALKNAMELELLNKFVDKVEEKIKSEISQEEELGEIPDEFLDPLLFTLMEEPVILPASQVTIDLATIKSHLLSDNHDPFNRQPLKIEDVIPNVELKEKIAAWKETVTRKHTAMAWPSPPEPEFDDITNGIETVISKNLLDEMNPLVFRVIELVLTQMDLPIPPSQIPVGPLGTLRVFFNDARCSGVRVEKNSNAGVFFDTDIVGLTFKMDLKCNVNFTTNLRFLQNGTADITINGVNPFAELGLSYISDTKQLTPVLKTFDIKFDSINADMDRKPFVNVFLKVFHHLLPPIVSFSMKAIVRSLVPRISALLIDPKIEIPNSHGSLDPYHVAVNEPPVLNKQYAKFNVSLEEGNGHAFTQMRDESKKSPFELYLEGYRDGNDGNLYRIMGLDLEKDFQDELKAQNVKSSEYITTPSKKRRFGFSKKYEESSEEREVTPPRVHYSHNNDDQMIYF